MGSYAVIDIETTGFSPAQHHRIMEIAVVLVDDAGSRVDEWETLVNPKREVGATKIHGLAGKDVHRAPVFADIAPTLSKLLQGKVVVAHNLAFDASFVAAEFARVGYSLNLDANTGLCTMRMAAEYLPVKSRALASCCAYIGYPLHEAHTALADAQATAELLAHFMEQDENFVKHWSNEVAAARKIKWPKFQRKPSKPLTRAERREQGVHFLDALPERDAHDRGRGFEGFDEYIKILHKALLDREISSHETDEIIRAARGLKLCRDEAVSLNFQYLTALARLALKNGSLSASARIDLNQVASLLGLSLESVDSAAELACEGEGTTDIPMLCELLDTFCLEAGDRVVFTGKAQEISRAELEEYAYAVGLRVTGSVSGKTALVAAADPDSLSGKARRARELGIPIVNYRAFLRMLELVSDAGSV
ncbi:MAG: hypothetical protein GX316_05925 [Firmicutes bacterium]|nr:hypothetical protein [Bacillota bacterium]